MRYIYSLRKKEERDTTNLKNYENEIRKSLTSFNIGEENYIIINKDSFEFSFSGCIPKSHLQKMGKLLAGNGVGKGGFIRQKNKAYAFLSYDQSRVEEEQVLVELADCSTVDLENRSGREDMPEWVSFYRRVELSTSYISPGRANSIFAMSYESENEEKNIFLVELKHRHIEYNKYLELINVRNNTVRRYQENSIKNNTCIIEHLYSSGSYQTDFVDLVDIKLIDNVSDKDSQILIDKFNVEIEPHNGNQYSENKSNKSENDQYTFTVHNVGQALATSLREKGKLPFFYFDYGIAYGNNKFTIPTHVNLPIAEDATILLSHVDENHWCGFRINPEALKCRWIIPQKPTKALAKVLASVYMSGGSISLYRANGLNIFRIKNVNNCMVAGNAKSTIKPARIPKKVHETGNALYIFAQYEEAEYKIVVSGDQDYDYQNKKYLSDINLLVACHHGGKYSWSKKTTLPDPDTDKNEIVYSYGDNNQYNHPSKVSEHQSKGWKTEHRTPKDGDYEIDLNLMDNSSLARIIKASNPTGMEFIL